MAGRCPAEDPPTAAGIASSHRADRPKRIARRADIRPDAAGRAVAADHVEELMRREMRQFVETDQRDLSALPVVDGGFKLQVRKLDLAGARPAPLAHTEVRGPADPWIEV